MAFDGEIMTLDSGAENLFDVKTETVIAGRAIYLFLKTRLFLEFCVHLNIIKKGQFQIGFLQKDLKQPIM